MSKIEWTETTWNPITGCTKISEGCKNCYAEKMAKRLKGRYGYPQEEPFSPTFHLDKLTQPFGWKKPRMIFVVSMGDLFHEDVTNEQLDRIFQVMECNTNHTFQILTKRPERMLRYIIHVQGWSSIDFPKNIWIGVSAENQDQANRRIPILLQIPAAVRFVSCEPLLSAITIKDYFSPLQGEMSAGQRGLDWVICGGESGHNARPMHPDWARSLRDQCQAAGVPFFFKQWGEWSPEFPRKNEEPTCIVCGCTESNACEGGCEWITEGMFEICSRCGHVKVMKWDDNLLCYRRGKKAAGRLLDGKEWNEMPTAGHTEPVEVSTVTNYK